MKIEQATSLQPMQNSGPAKSSNTMWSICVALVVALIFWLFTWYGETTLSTVAIWQRSETYAHGYLIFPISAYLIWTKRDRIRGILPNPSIVGILLLAVLGVLWLVSHVAGALVAAQYALVSMIPALVWAVLGPKVVVALLFPLMFLLFAVPVGDFLLAPLMNFTADFTVAALRLTGIPVFREGNFFSVPSGSWSVVEACSGLRYLIASLTLGCLFAYLTYHSFWRRVIFIGLSIVVPIIANGIRAYMIVMIGHLSNNRLATGVDHVIYGWVFFGFVMMLLFWIGSRWREPDEYPDSVLANHSALDQGASAKNFKLALFAVLSAVTVAIWPNFAAHIEARTLASSSPVVTLPDTFANWSAAQERLSDWEPHYLTARSSVRQGYIKDGQKIEILIKYYRNQRQGAELINSVNQVVSTRDAKWGLVSSGAETFDSELGELTVSESSLRSAHKNLLVWSVYWVDGKYTSNSYLAKLHQAKAKILNNSDDAAAIFIYTTYDGKPDDARALLHNIAPLGFRSIDTTLLNAKH